MILRLLPQKIFGLTSYKLVYEITYFIYNMLYEHIVKDEV